MLAPRFSFTAGSLSSDSGAPASAPLRFVVERSADVPVDSLRVLLGDSGGVVPGDTVTLDLSAGDDGDALERVFTGSVAEVRPALGGCRLLCLGTMLALVDLRADGQYLDTPAGDVVRDLLGQAGLEAGQVEDGVTLSRYAVERRLGAFAQLKRLADRLGFSLFTDRNGKLHFRGLGAAGSLGSGGLGGALAGAAAGLGGGGASGLAYGQHLLTAQGAQRPALGRKVTVGGESPMSGQGEDKSHWLTATDSDYEDSAGSGDEWLVIDAAARTKDQAGRFAAGYLAGFERRVQTLQLSVFGLPTAELGDSFKASGAPEDGLNTGGTVTALRHRFGAREGFVTDLTLAVEGEA